MVLHRCVTCGKELKGMPYAKVLKSLGYCFEHVPEKYRCPGKLTKSGNPCKKLAIGGGLCKQHKQSENAKKRKEKQAGPVKEGNCHAITTKRKRCSRKAVDGNLCKQHSKSGKLQRAYNGKQKRLEIQEKKANSRPDYQTYIQSTAWKEKSTEAKKRAGWRCQICNRHDSYQELATHHRTYKRLGHELPTDLTVLCIECHNLYHHHLKKKKGANR